jgi:hypothetical protein
MLNSIIDFVQYLWYLHVVYVSTEWGWDVYDDRKEVGKLVEVLGFVALAMIYRLFLWILEFLDS